MAEGVTEEGTQYAGFWLRWIAVFIDSIVVNIASVALALVSLLFLSIPSGGEMGSFMDLVSGGFFQILVFGASIAVDMFYSVWTHYRYGQTVGKMVFKIKVIDEKTGGALTLKQSFGRYFARGLSAIILYIGFVMAAFDSKKKALHDSLSGTLSVRI